MKIRKSEISDLGASSKGQLEVSFQWMFVLIGGLAFLVMFFLLARGCAQQGEERITGLAVQEAAQRLEAAVWQPESTFNMTVHPVSVRCPGGTLTLTSESALSTLDRVPLFLPPEISGRVQIRTEPLALSGDIAPDIALGSVLYAIDEQTYYIIVTGSSGSYPLDDFTGGHPNIRRIPVTEIQDAEAVAELVPSNARHVVIVAEDNEGYVSNTDVSLIPESATVTGVSITSTGATFFSRQGGLVKNVLLPAETPEFQAGAVVSTDPGSYRCGRDNIAARLEKINAIYEERAVRISEDTSAACTVTFEKVIQILNETNQETGDAFLEAFFESSDEIVQLQESLLRQSCPVIA